jgi:ribonuclease Y
MHVAISRYRNHFLTERSISRLPLVEGMNELLISDDARLHRGLEEVSNVQLLIGDDGDAVRLDGLDGVGREVARRAINRLNKKPAVRAEAVKDPVAWATAIRTHLDREIHSLGTKAFSMLEIPRAHDEIVDLVGALNYRTSYTQNQWRHAVEAAFLAGMIAEEIGLDVKLARRAALIHDIGKALTHKIEGSHAVIGAEIARRRGEDEVVANAMGAHHLDEPMNSAYAYLIAAADAMSGGRPGARREFADGYTSRLHDLERIGCSFGGVDRAHAVHGGRELRVYVRENEVSDERAAEIATEVAARLSEELTFPGQIKVTAIRAYEAVSTAS